ncbi:MAG: TetR/AcrR family transcriptional regulator [Acidimicrobiia bacterium]|nr:TetR/AcrR family transcriptional regulator [Acidimicrobiia bacterium]
MTEPAQRMEMTEGERRRLEILAAARHLFLEHGYHATTTRMIARHVQMSDALLYRYFPSKRELFDAVIDEGLRHLQPYVQFGAPLLKGLQLRETLEAAAYTAVEIARRDSDVFRLIIAESTLLEGDRRITDVIDDLLNHFAARIRDFIEAGEARQCNAYVFARQFIGGIVMSDLSTSLLGVGISTEEPEVPIDDYLSEVVEAAARSLRLD